MSLLPIYIPIGIVAVGALLEYLLDIFEDRLVSLQVRRIWSME